MKVRFAVDVLNNPQAWDSLDQIVDYFITGRHLWDINDVDDIENSDWIQEDIEGRAGKRNLDTLERCYTDSIYSPNSRKHRMHAITLLVTFSGNSNNELTPDEAKRYLSKPAYVAVENQTSDGAFLDAMIHAFGRNQLREAQTEGWWEYAHLGGFGEIEKRIEHIRAKTMGPLRILVVADSDRRYPYEVTPTIKKVERYCDKVGDVPYVILRKRKIENYLPISTLWSVHVPKRFRNIYKAFVSLKPEQQDHYEIKKGFKKDKNGHAIVPEEQKALFQHVPRKILDDLCGGFGDEIWKYFESARESITEDAIRLTCLTDPDEILRLLDWIECQL